MYRKNLIGKKIGRLKILSYNKETKKWICKCDCNNIIEVTTSHLNSKSVKSCGCLRHNLQKTNDNVYKKITKLKKFWNRINEIEKIKDWKDWNDFFQWALSQNYFTLTTIKKITRKKPYTKENLQIGIRYNKIFIPLKDLKKYYIYYDKDNETFAISFKYNNININYANIKSIKDLATEHISLWNRFFKQKSIFEKNNF